MTDEAACVGMDVAKGTLDLAISNSREAKQLRNDHKGKEIGIRSSWILL